MCFYCNLCKHAIIIEWESTLTSAEKKKKQRESGRNASFARDSENKRREEHPQPQEFYFHLMSRKETGITKQIVIPF